MLKSIDVLIGLTVVVLALSMAVTVITQSITTMLNSRGRHLRRGLTDLLQQLDPALTGTLSKSVATTVLTHPLVSASNSRLGSVIHREEFTKLLMVLAADPPSGGLEDAAKNALKTALTKNGVTDPDAVLKSIRARALQLERTSPDIAHAVRQNMAILEAAESDLVAKINNWFDQTMDRTSQRFTASTRAITFVGAFIVAFGLQVDTPSLVNRLAADETLRAALIREAQVLNQGRQDATEKEAASASAGDEEIERRYRAFLAANGIIRLPSSAGWLEGFSLSSSLGMLVTALLLSLGAPFWYNALGKLLQLRSVLAAKDDAQRSERQSTN